MLFPLVNSVVRYELHKWVRSQKLCFWEISYGHIFPMFDHGMLKFGQQVGGTYHYIHVNFGSHWSFRFQ